MTPPSLSARLLPALRQSLVLLVVMLFQSGQSLSLLTTVVSAADLRGITVTPHVIAESMRYRRPRDPDLAAKVQLFVQGAAWPQTFAGRSPQQLLAAGEWAWHDLDTAVRGEPESLTVWTWNGKTSRWGVGQVVEVIGEGLPATRLELAAPQRWIAAVTFLDPDAHPQPREMIVHVVNQDAQPLTIQAVRVWLPREGKSWQTLYAQPPQSVNVPIPAHDRGWVRLTFPQPLPLTYVAVELQTSAGSLWEHLRVKRESFDIGGGWIADHLREEPYLRLLSHLHVNFGQIQGVPGYTDNEQLYGKYPFKLCNRLWPLEEWDTDQWLSRIHAVEFLGEPQYGGGRPVPPQEVFDKFLPYRSSRLATSVTHSEERVWRYYAGLSDFPHYDAYRVVAPAADSWRDYDRWDGKRISWGAPLETIGDMCRSLREINRPLPVAYWSQGPHHGWGGGFLSNRRRRSPTPAELRAQAQHALSTRITSLYWFNLSLKSLQQFPDTWDPIMRIGREIKMLAPYYLAGAADHFERTRTDQHRLDWDFATIVAPDCAVLFANDLAYIPDPNDNTFRFGEPREFTHLYPLPHWLREPVEVFRVDADGIHEVTWNTTATGVELKHRATADAIFVAAKNKTVRAAIETRRQQALDWETRHPIEFSGDGAK
ncbi:MAG: hypothetical protein ACKOBW_03380 [Planctomycetota bacterium]